MRSASSVCQRTVVSPERLGGVARQSAVFRSDLTGRGLADASGFFAQPASIEPMPRKKDSAKTAARPAVRFGSGKEFIVERIFICIVIWEKNYRARFLVSRNAASFSRSALSPPI